MPRGLVVTVVNMCNADGQVFGTLGLCRSNHMSGHASLLPPAERKAQDIGGKGDLRIMRVGRPVMVTKGKIREPPTWQPTKMERVQHAFSPSGTDVRLEVLCAASVARNMRSTVKAL